MQTHTHTHDLQTNYIQYRVVMDHG